MLMIIAIIKGKVEVLTYLPNLRINNNSDFQIEIVILMLITIKVINNLIKSIFKFLSSKID
jgi:hypothetical protein